MYLKAFVSCAWGISNIGYVMICFGVTNAVAAPTIGTIVKLTGRKPVMALAFVLHMTVLIFLRVWKPSPDQGSIFFLMSGLWGLCDAVWLVQVNGNYQINPLITAKANFSDESFSHFIFQTKLPLALSVNRWNIPVNGKCKVIEQKDFEWFYLEEEHN